MVIYLEFDKECLDIEEDTPSQVIIEEEECVKLDFYVEYERCIP